MRTTAAAAVVALADTAAMQLPLGLELLAGVKAAACTAAAAVAAGAGVIMQGGSPACAAAPGPPTHLDIASTEPETIWWPLLASTLAGLSTSIGGVIAVALSPDDATLAFLLGTAIGVMGTVSGMELWWHSATELHDWPGVTACMLAGAALFALLDPLLPDIPDGSAEDTPAAQEQPGEQQQQYQQQQQQHVAMQAAGEQKHARSEAWSGGSPPSSAGSGSSSGSGTGNSSMRRRSALQVAPAINSNPAAGSGTEAAPLPDPQSTGWVEQQHQQHQQQPPLIPASIAGHASGGNGGSSSASAGLSAAHAGDAGGGDAPTPGMRHRGALLRLSLLTAITMTLHNLPEGFAVAFSAFTDTGPIMVLAIGLHNIPEGLICAAPLYAATGSRLQAVGLATASGMSEPLGALLALLVFKPFIRDAAALDYVLAATGGVMLAVCVLELWPEGRRCGQDARLAAGVGLGAAVMGWTLAVGV